MPVATLHQLVSNLVEEIKVILHEAKPEILLIVEGLNAIDLHRAMLEAGGLLHAVDKEVLQRAHVGAAQQCGLGVRLAFDGDLPWERP